MVPCIYMEHPEITHNRQLSMYNNYAPNYTFRYTFRMIYQTTRLSFLSEHLRSGLQLIPILWIILTHNLLALLCLHFTLISLAQSQYRTRKIVFIIYTDANTCLSLKAEFWHYNNIIVNNVYSPIICGTIKWTNLGKYFSFPNTDVAVNLMRTGTKQ